jgi:hypothetical protein
MPSDETNGCKRRGNTWQEKQDAVSEMTGATGDGPGALNVLMDEGRTPVSVELEQNQTGAGDEDR